MPIIIEKGDITLCDVDAIVNAANNALCGGGGVDGAIHSAAGKELLDECRKIGRCETGFAVLTNGYRLKATYIIHAVGPVWQGGAANEAALLRSCYIESLRIADMSGFKTIAFPSISTGAYRFPLKAAAKIAITTISEQLEQGGCIEDVYIICYDDKTKKAYSDTLTELTIL